MAVNCGRSLVLSLSHVMCTHEHARAHLAESRVSYHTCRHCLRVTDKLMHIAPCLRASLHAGEPRLVTSRVAPKTSCQRLVVGQVTRLTLAECIGCKHASCCHAYIHVMHPSARLLQAAVQRRVVRNGSVHLPGRAALAASKRFAPLGTCLLLQAPTHKRNGLFCTRRAPGFSRAIGSGPRSSGGGGGSGNGAGGGPNGSSGSGGSGGGGLRGCLWFLFCLFAGISVPLMLLYVMHTLKDRNTPMDPPLGGGTHGSERGAQPEGGQGGQRRASGR